MNKQLAFLIIRRCVFAGFVIALLGWLGWDQITGSGIPSTNQVSILGYDLFELPFEVSRLTDAIALPILLAGFLLAFRYNDSSSIGVTFGGAFGLAGGLIYFWTSHYLGFVIPMGIGYVITYVISLGIASDSNNLTWKVPFIAGLGFAVGMSIAFLNLPLIFVLGIAIAIFLVYVIPTLIAMVIAWLTGFIR